MSDKKYVTYEEFGAVGSQGYLQKRFGLTAEKIEEAVHTVLKRKG